MGRRSDTAERIAQSMKRVDALRKGSPTSYGRKDSEGTNRGKKATHYVAFAPDGTTFYKKSYLVNADIATLGIYLHEGTWYAAGIVSYASLDKEGILRPVYSSGMCMTQIAITAYRKEYARKEMEHVG